ncbi:hypothetical protein XU06_29860 (plasmid) [Rhodococcus erythropolis]|nr:hypothetical protein XU06_29860 [Rhodococcus erythropolis]
MFGGHPQLLRHGAVDRRSRLQLEFLLQAMVMGCNGFLHRLGEVVPQMPAVGDLDRPLLQHGRLLPYARARSRQITCVPGCSMNHLATVSAFQSARTSTGQ